MTKASARKGKNGYKPIIKYSNGKTKVVEQSPLRKGVYTKEGFIPGDKYARGKVYSTREEALEAAQAALDKEIRLIIERTKKSGTIDTPYVKALLESYGVTL